MIDLLMIVGAFVFSVALMISIVWRASRRDKHCCDRAMKDPSLMVEMGVSVFGDVLERCEACGCVTVYVVNGGGKSIEKLIMTKSKWEEMYASVSPEDVQRAKRLTRRAGESGGVEAGREEAAGVG